jgi:hypothetical protein
MRIALLLSIVGGGRELTVFVIMNRKSLLKVKYRRGIAFKCNEKG